MSTSRRFYFISDNQGRAKEFRSICGDANDALTPDGYPNFSLSWRSHEVDLAEFSKKYPDELFILHVIDDSTGDDDGAEWMVYAKNGKVMIARITKVFTPFDENLLQEPDEFA